MDFLKLSADYQQALLRQVVPFWLKHSSDKLCGGYFDLLGTKGEVIKGDKYVTLQAQQSYAFAWLYNTFDGQQPWLDHALHGATFLSQFAHDDTFTCYAQLDRRGRAVAPAADVAPDCYVTMAYAQLHRATQDDTWAMLAKQTFTNLLRRRNALRSEQAQALGGFRQVRHLSEPVAVFQAVREMQPLLDEESYKEAVETVLHELLYEFLDRRTETLRASILPEGAFLNTPDGRQQDVGLTFRAAGLLLDEAADTKNRRLTTQVLGWCLNLCEQAWDEATAGLLTYIDLKQQPPLRPDWRTKWAWVQLEALATLAKAHLHTRNADTLKWFRRVHDYVFAKFPDVAMCWHLALDAQHQPVLSAKATSDVGCFSLIRCLAETARTLNECHRHQATKEGRTAPVDRRV